jgi:GNAT superfamily N-acetyltransferase
MDMHFSPSWIAASDLLAAEVVKRLPQGNLTIRPIDLADLDLEVQFLTDLSQTTRYQRMLGTVSFKSIDRVRELLDHIAGPSMALGAILNDGQSGPDGQSLAQLIGVARYAPTEQAGMAEMAVVLADGFQGQGLGRLLLERLHPIARAYGYRELNGLTFANNRAMLRLARTLDYSEQPEPGDGSLRRITKSLLTQARSESAVDPARRSAIECDSAEGAEGAKGAEGVKGVGTHPAQDFLDHAVSAMLLR